MNRERSIWQAPGAWHKPCIVHVTMVANGRRALFGELAHNGEKAEVQKTPLGWILINEQRRMRRLCPEVLILADKVMPDHHHMVLQVTREMERSIREAVRGYMQGCKKAAREQGFTEPLYDGAPHFRVLTHRGQLDAMIHYVDDNAERAWQRKVHPELFRLRRETACYVPFKGIASPPLPLRFSSLGNHWLLDWPDRQLIELSRSATEEQIAASEQRALRAAENGAVSITAAVSAGEKRIARALREAGYPLVVLLTDGFPAEGSEAERFYKPGGVYFEACVAGRLLLMEPTVATLGLAEVSAAVEAALRRKADEKHLIYSPIPTDSRRWRFIALNELGRMLAER